MDTILETLIKFQNQNPNIYIGGSVSLMLQGVIPYRIPKDIDIITPNKTHIFEIFGINDRPKHRMIRIHRFDGLLFELFHNPDAEYLEYDWKGNILKISPIDEIYKWKLKDRNIVIEKHLRDLEYLYKKHD